MHLCLLSSDNSEYSRFCGRSLSDLMIRHQLQSPHQRRVVPSGSSTRGAGAEELLACGGVGQRELERASSLQREAEVLLVKFDAEAWIEGSLDHALAVHFEY